MASPKKFPVGTTVHYIAQLRAQDPLICGEIAKNYNSLTFANTDYESGSKFQLLNAILSAVGELKTEGK